MAMYQFIDLHLFQIFRLNNMNFVIKFFDPDMLGICRLNLNVVIEIASGVLVLAEAITKVDVGKDPCTEGAPKVQQNMRGKPANQS